MDSKNEKLLYMIYQVFDLSKRAWNKNRKERGMELEAHPEHADKNHRRHHGHDKLRGASLNRALKVLEENPGLKPSELAALLEIRPQSVTGLVDRMEENEFVERVADSQDRRIWRLYLTEKGKDICKIASTYQSEVADAFFLPFTEEEKETLIFLMGKLVAYHKNKEIDNGDL